MEDYKGQAENKLLVLQAELEDAKKELDRLRPVAQAYNASRSSKALEEASALIANLQTQNKWVRVDESIWDLIVSKISNNPLVLADIFKMRWRDTSIWYRKLAMR